MRRTDPPDTPRPAADANRPSLSETLDQVERSLIEFEQVRAQGKAIADLARTLDSMADEDEALPAPEMTACKDTPVRF